MDAERHVFGITRPHPNLMKLYVVRSLLALPLAPILLPFLYFRYKTLHYTFDDEGIAMGWGILFRKEIHLTYARIQDIHLSSGLIQRWMGLADLQIQTASGSASAEMTIEGLLEHEMVRDYLYQRMRGLRAPSRGGATAAAAAAATSRAAGDPASPAAAAPEAAGEAVQLLHAIAADLRATREILERAGR